MVLDRPSDVEPIEFSDEQRRLLDVIKSRFEVEVYLHQGVSWDEVETSLKYDAEALADLKWMEDTGGEPDVLRVEGDEFIFGDTSVESPLGRRNIMCSQAKKALRKGLEIMSEDDYMYLQRHKLVDLGTRSILGKPSEKRRPLPQRYVLYGYRPDGMGNKNPREGICAYPDREYFDERIGFRCTRKVKRKS